MINSELKIYKNYKKCAMDMTRLLLRTDKLKYIRDIQLGHSSKYYVENEHYSIDHKFSIRKAFDLNMPYCIVSNIYNLELLKQNENLSKGDKCSITLDELIDGYKKFCIHYNFNDKEKANQWIKSYEIKKLGFIKYYF